MEQDLDEKVYEETSYFRQLIQALIKSFGIISEIVSYDRSASEYHNHKNFSLREPLKYLPFFEEISSLC